MDHAFGGGVAESYSQMEEPVRHAGRLQPRRSRPGSGQYRSFPQEVV